MSSKADPEPVGDERSLQSGLSVEQPETRVLQIESTLLNQLSGSPVKRDALSYNDHARGPRWNTTEGRAANAVTVLGARATPLIRRRAT